MEWFEDEVRSLERTHVNGTRPPVFYGSSSFRLWGTLADDFDPRVLNLGFGGSTLQACDHFFERLIPPVKPRSLLLYAGDNDLGDGRAPDEALASFRSLAEKVSGSLGSIPFGFVSVKPSPARFPLINEIRELNDLVRHEINSIPAAYYVDIYSSMLDAERKPRSELFLEDGLHLNRTGYQLWSRLLEHYRNQIFTT